MRAMEAVKQAAKESGISLYRISIGMGKTRQYVSSTITNGSTPKADTLANMLNQCGFGLYAIPYESAPDNALQITDSGQGENTGDK